MEYSILFRGGRSDKEVKPREDAISKGFVAYPQALLIELTPEQIRQQQEIYQKVYAEARAAAAGWRPFLRKELPFAARN